MEARSQTAPQAHVLRGSNSLILYVHCSIRQCTCTEKTRPGYSSVHAVESSIHGASVLWLAEGDLRRDAEDGCRFHRRLARPALHLILLQSDGAIGDLGVGRPSIEFC